MPKPTQQHTTVFTFTIARPEEIGLDVRQIANTMRDAAAVIEMMVPFSDGQLLDPQGLQRCEWNGQSVDIDEQG
jgi:hypothetical protein